jgi:glycerate kinase
MGRVRVLIAPDKFAETLTAPEAAAAIAAGWRRHDPGAELDLAPLSDGGPGFVEVLHAALGGRLVEVTAHGPLGDPTPGTVLLAPDGTAYVEVAQACGLHLLPLDGRRPMEAGSAGVADLLRAALDIGARRVVVGVGGTASTDGGRPCVEAFGGAGSWPAGIPLVVATDVDAPLLGPNGAAAVFGPQKGADRDQVLDLQVRLAEWAKQSGGDASAEGAGAGGGLGYGLMLLGGTRVPGVQTVVEALRLPQRVVQVDLALTGEGTFDETSLRGKVPRGVAWVAQRAGRPCVVLAGRVLVGRREFAAAGIDAAYAVEETAGSVAAALAEPAARLADLAERVARTWTPRSSVR